MKTLKKAEDPKAYAKMANEGMMLAYPVKINGKTHRPDTNTHYHSTIKVFNTEKDHPHTIHNLARNLPLNPPDAKNTQIEPGQFKGQNGVDHYVLKLKGNSAEKLQEHNGKFAHMGDPQPYNFQAHVTVDKPTWDQVKASGAKTAHEAGLHFGNAELKRGPKTLKTYHHAPDTTEPVVPDAGDFTSSVKVAKSEHGIKSLIKSDHSLHKFGKALALTGDAFKNYVEDTNLLKLLQGK